MKNDDKRKKNIIIASIIIFVVGCLIIVGIFIAQTISRIGKIAITVKYAPYNASVIANGIQLKNNAVNYLPAGEYTIEAKADHFDTFNNTVIISNDTNAIYGLLNPNDERGKELMSQHQADFFEVQSYYSADSIKQGEDEKKTWPLLNYLPVSNRLYSIGYILDEDNLTITINTTTPYLDSVVQILSEFDQSQMTLAEYNIRINNLANPFNHFTDNTNANPSEFIKTGFIDSVSDLDIQLGTIEGDYYYTTITTGSISDYSLVTYRVVLKKDSSDSSWKLMSTPCPVLTIYNTTDVPLNILNKVNRLPIQGA